MRQRYALALAIALCACSVASADIIDWNCGADGDGAIIMNSVTWNDATYTLNANGNQYWWPAHILGDFTTDTELDPTVWVRNTVLNDGEVEPLVWTDYHINISMNKVFTIDDAATLPDWTFNIGPVVQQGTQWVGTVDYFAGTPVTLGNWGEFDLKISFLGSISFTQELIPTPEPATLVLLAFGGLALLRRR